MKSIICLILLSGLVITKDFLSEFRSFLEEDQSKIDELQKT
jgi:hypothetical protein